MRLFNLRTLHSSFWLGFVIVLIVNQLVLFVAFTFLIVKPFSTNLAQIIGTAVEATALAYKQDQLAGSDDLQRTISYLPEIVVLQTEDQWTEIPLHYVGLTLTRRTLESVSNGKIRIGYSPPPHEGLLVKSIDHPDLILRINYQGKVLGLRFLGIALLLIILISTGAAIWISARLVQPLHQLANAASRLGKDKDFRKIQEMPRSSREISQLVGTLNEMRAALDASIKERESLLAGVTHDLRTPLSRMRFALELDGNNLQELTKDLREDVIEMSAIMEQFNELARLNLETNEPWDLGDINRLIQGLQTKYERAGIDLILELDFSLPAVRYKPLALTRLLYNLIDNAYRHGVGDITISTKQVGDRILLTVSNEIAEEGEGSGLFKALSEQSSGRTAGLGLSIARRFAEVHGAELQDINQGNIKEYVLAFSLTNGMECDWTSSKSGLISVAQNTV